MWLLMWLLLLLLTWIEALIRHQPLITGIRPYARYHATSDRA
jgi:hypothetical protein